MDFVEEKETEVYYKRSIPGFDEFRPNNWFWDSEHKSCDVKLSTNQLAAYFHIEPAYESHGTAGVRGTKGLNEGEHYWEVIFTEPLCGTSVMVGVGTKRTKLHMDNDQFVDMLGLDDQSWGLSYKGTIWHQGKYQRYCEPFFDTNTRIGILLNLYTGILTFFKNGISLGVAFRDLHKVGMDLYPMSSSTAAETEVELGIRISHKRKIRLEDKCLAKILQNISASNKDAIDILPLPYTLKTELKDMRR